MSVFDTPFLYDHYMYIKKILIILINILICLHMQAQKKKNPYMNLTYSTPTIEAIEGKLPYMFDEKIKTSLDCSKAIYMPKKIKYDPYGNKLSAPKITGSSFHIFLEKYKRDKDWAEKSLSYFCEHFNEKSSNIITCVDCDTTNYELVIRVLEVYKNGYIKAHVILKDTKTDKELCYFEVNSKDGDTDDEITLRDQMKDIGNTIGSIITTIQKYEAKQMRKNKTH